MRSPMKQQGHPSRYNQAPQLRHMHSLGMRQHQTQPSYHAAAAAASPFEQGYEDPQYHYCEPQDHLLPHNEFVVGDGDGGMMDSQYDGMVMDENGQQMVDLQPEYGHNDNEYGNGNEFRGPYEQHQDFDFAQGGPGNNFLNEPQTYYDSSTDGQYPQPPLAQHYKHHQQQQQQPLYADEHGEMWMPPQEHAYDFDHQYDDVTLAVQQHRHAPPPCNESSLHFSNDHDRNNHQEMMPASQQHQQLGQDQGPQHQPQQQQPPPSNPYQKPAPAHTPVPSTNNSGSISGLQRFSAASSSAAASARGSSTISDRLSQFAAVPLSNKANHHNNNGHHSQVNNTAPNNHHQPLFNSMTVDSQQQQQQQSSQMQAFEQQQQQELQQQQRDADTRTDNASHTDEYFGHDDAAIDAEYQAMGEMVDNLLEKAFF
jgi:hypothetical protein